MPRALFSRLRSSRLARGCAIAALIVPAALTACVPANYQATSPAAAAGSASGPAASAQAKEVDLTVKEWGFQPAAFQLPLNQPVKLVVKNDGQIDHDLTIPDLGVHLPVNAGKTASTTVTAAKAGSFAFECSIPGHLEAGMKGTVTVAEGAAAAGGGPAPSDGTTMAMSSTSAQATMPAMGSHAAQVTTAVKGGQQLAYHMDGSTKVFDLTAQQIKWEVLPGELVDAYAYNGMVPGPLIRVQQGDRVRINLKNQLNEPTVLHLHGPTLPNDMDGVADVTQTAIQPGQTFSYEFTAEPTGTFTYHSHYNSAVQEGKGLYGVLIIDPKTKPTTYDKDVVEVLSELGGYYLINGKSFPATEPIEAKVGEKVLIHLVDLGQMTHPMHLHGQPFTIVATDGYPVPPAAQLTKDVIDIAPGERYDLLLNDQNPGTWLFHCHILAHVQNHGVEPGGMLTVVKVTS